MQAVQHPPQGHPAILDVEEIDRATCLSLLASQPFGRLAVIHEGYPEIYPVNYRLDGERIVIRSTKGAKLAHASLDRVAFEVDAYDEAAGRGWSVLAKGTARDITTAIDAASERERQLALEPFGTEVGHHWVRIAIHQLSGRRFRRLDTVDA